MQTPVHEAKWMRRIDGDANKQTRVQESRWMRRTDGHAKMGTEDEVDKAGTDVDTDTST